MVSRVPHLAAGAGARTADRLGAELLLDAGAVLAGSLEPAVTMRHLAELTVPRLADLCVIDLVDAEGSIRGVAVVATDPELERALVELRSAHPLDPASEHPVAAALRAGQPMLVPEISHEMLRAWARSDSHAEFMIAREYRSVVVAPLIARNRTLGVLSLLRLGDCTPYEESDLALVTELARRAAPAIDNGRLYSELRQLEQRLEAILAGLAEAITVVDTGGVTVYANQAAADLLGAGSPDELVGHPPGSIMRRFVVLDEHGEELELGDMPGRRLLRGEPADPLLVRNVIPETGEDRWLMVRASPIRDPQTQRTTHVVNVFENVTELKRAELAERFLADASRLLAAPSHHHSLDQVAGLVATRIGDWCAIDLLAEDGRVERAALRSSGEGVIDLGATLPEEPHIDDRSGLGALIRTGTLAVLPPAGPGAQATGDAYTSALRAAGAAAVIVAPMVAGRTPVGAITVAIARTPRRFSSANVALVTELGRRAGIAVENARRYSERSRIAHILQQALLPESLPASEVLDVHAVYEAVGELNEVGGDFYDVLEYGEGRWLVLIGDVCGKGPRAAGMTALARHTLRAAAISGQPPTTMLATLHEALRRQQRRPEPCTVCVVLVEPSEGRARLTVALGGHHPPLLVAGDRAARPLGRIGTLLGAVDPITVHATEGGLERGETLLLYTDGVIDAGRPGRPLGEAGLVALATAAAELPLGAMLEQIRAATVEHAGRALRDDIALLGVRLR